MKAAKEQKPDGYIRTLKPQETPLFKMKLDWMRDNHPEYLMDLYREGTLQQTILEAVEKADDHYMYLLKEGVDEEIAKEIRTDLLAPAEGLGMREVPKIPYKVWETIQREMTR